MIERLSWTKEACEDYTWRQRQGRKTLKRLNRLIEDSMRQPFEGIGKPEPLKGNLTGFWSRRIDETHRLVYAVDGNRLVVISCRYHY